MCFVVVVAVVVVVYYAEAAHKIIKHILLSFLLFLFL